MARLVKIGRANLPGELQVHHFLGLGSMQELEEEFGGFYNRSLEDVK